MAYKEYKVLYVTEGGLGTIFLGASGIPVKRLEATLGLPPFAVVTQLGCVDDDKTQFKITFADTARLDGEDEIMSAIEKHHNVQREAILFPYQPPSEEEKPKAKPKAGAKAKKY